MNAPQLHVVNVHVVASYCIGGSVVAAALAFLARGGIGSPLSSLQYAAAWLSISAMVAIWWIRVQWQRRPSLPPTVRMSPAWSPGCAILLLHLIFAPAYVAAIAVDHSVRGLISRAELQADITRFEKPHWGPKRRTMYAGFEAQCSEALLERYGHPDVHGEGCKSGSAAVEQATANLGILARAHGLYDYESPVGAEPRLLLALCSIITVLAVGASAAGVVSATRVLEVGAGLWLGGGALIVALAAVGREMVPRSGRTAGQVVGTLVIGARVVSGLVLLVLALSMVVRFLWRAKTVRTALSDVAMIVLLCSPACLLSLDVSVNALHDEWPARHWNVGAPAFLEEVSKQAYLWLVLAGGVLGGLAITPLLSSYRRAAKAS